MKCIRILNKVPSFFEIYQFFSHKDTTRYVFEDTYLFKDYNYPLESELSILESQQIKLDDLIILTPELIDRFGPKFLSSTNCIHVYKRLDCYDKTYLKFGLQNWEWTYYCHDDVLVELFIRVNHEDAIDQILNRYNCKNIKFPGSLSSPGGLNILAE